MSLLNRLIFRVTHEAPNPPGGYATEYRCVDCGERSYAFGHWHLKDGWHDAVHPADRGFKEGVG